MAKLLVIEDEENLRFSITRALRKDGHEVVETARLDDASELLRHTAFDGVITDVNLGPGPDPSPGTDRTGIDLIRSLREEGFEGAAVVITAYGTVEKAVEAMRLGADDYLQKPLRLDELSLVVARTLEARRTRARLSLYERGEAARAEAERPIGRSPGWLSTISLAERFARLPLPAAGEGATAPVPMILLLGETGVGKGVLARHVHATAVGLGTTSDAPFVHVNCSALPSALIESELFGHERGAFTDARSARAGLFEMAEGGTIFLDEIGDLPLELQGKLLLVVEHAAYRRVGGARERRASVRIIAATNQDLAARAGKGLFRADLFYRLSAFTVTIPALRDRADDIVPLAEAVLERSVRAYRGTARRFSTGALEALRRHQWPGNVRELANAVQRAAMLCEHEEVSAADLALPQCGNPLRSAPLDPAAGADASHHDAVNGAALTNGAVRFDFSKGPCSADEVERQLIIQALHHAQGNVSKAARLIGMNRGSLRYRIERANLEHLVQKAPA
ncbi:MAG: sigma-54-dependent transcriptional regulator [Phycisphaerales bacterium]